MNKLDRIKELVELLNKAGKSYYSEGQEIMTNFEYDALYDELKGLEEKTGYVLSNSPTVNVGYEVLSELPKERHENQGQRSTQRMAWKPDRSSILEA